METVLMEDPLYLYCIVASQRFASQSAVSAQINDSKRLLLAGASISKKSCFYDRPFYGKIWKPENTNLL